MNKKKEKKPLFFTKSMMFTFLWLVIVGTFLNKIGFSVFQVGITFISTGVYMIILNIIKEDKK